MPEALSIAVCESLASEVSTALAAESLQDVRLVTLPAACESPKPSWREIATLLDDGPQPSNFCLLSCGAFQPGCEMPRELESRCLWRTDRCLNLLAGGATVDAYFEGGAFPVSPGWLRHWRAHARQWGCEPGEARERFGKLFERLVLLDSGLHPGSREALRELSDFLGRPAESVPVGLSYLRLF
jgi:hypothetical protein